MQPGLGGGGNEPAAGGGGAQDDVVGPRGAHGGSVAFGEEEEGESQFNMLTTALQSGPAADKFSIWSIQKPHKPIVTY